jgi:hypothetical protein
MRSSPRWAAPLNSSMLGAWRRYDAPYGVRKQREHGNARTESGLGSFTSTPRWVKVFGVIVIILILMVGVMLLGGGHGPGAHLSSDS